MFRNAFCILEYTFSGKFRGELSRLHPPPSGRWTDAVTHGTPDMCQRYCMMATPSPVYLLKLAKHGIQNIQNDCHQWLSVSCRVHQIRFVRGSAPDPRWGCSPRFPSCLTGFTSQGKGRGWRGEEEGKNCPPFRKFLDPPLLNIGLLCYFFCCSLFVAGLLWSADAPPHALAYIMICCSTSTSAVYVVGLYEFAAGRLRLVKSARLS